jgi:HD-GYP domain-containing protein (c-di-GMP phosphodiesterase class II)
MRWIAEAISEAEEDVAAEALAVLKLKAGEEVPSEAAFTGNVRKILRLLAASLRSGESADMVEVWEKAGRGLAGGEMLLREISFPDVVKRALWKVLERNVEDGSISLDELVESMMEVESLLEQCSSACLRGHLGSASRREEEKARRMRALYSLSELLACERDERSIHNAIAEKVAGITGLHRCTLLVFDEDGALFPAASNHEDGVASIKRSERALSWFRERSSEGKPTVADRRRDEPPGAQEVLGEYGAERALVVPMRSGGEDVGLIVLDNSLTFDFSLDLVELATAAAHQAAVTIEKSGLYAEMETRLKHLAAIGLVARTVSPYLSREEQLESLLDLSTVLVRASGASIFLKEEMFDRLEMAAGKGRRWWKDEETLVEVASAAMEGGRAVLLDREGEHQRLGAVEMDSRTSITAPLEVRDNPIGVITVSSDLAAGVYSDEDLIMFENFAAQAAVTLENTQLSDRLQSTYLGAIGSLAAAIEARDPYTVGHSTRVTQYAVAIAVSMELSSEEVEDIRLAGLLHDLGKIGVPDSILNKPGRLTEEEYSAIKMHPVLSMRIIEPLPHLGNIIPIIYHHHERYDGLGYVDGKSGESIPLGARILAVADSFEAMTSDRPYRRALSRGEAVAEIKRNSGTQFDPGVVGHFIALLEETADIGE